MSGVQANTNLAGANTAFLALFNELFSGPTPGPWALFTEVVPVPDSTTLELDQVVAASTVREWLGAKVVNKLRAYKRSEPMREWEYTVGVDRKDIDYDRLNIVGRKLKQQMNQVATNSLDRIMFLELVASTGAGPTGTDGVSLINDSHPMDDGTTQDNKGTTALSYAQHDTIMQAGESFKDHSGEPLGIRFDTLVVGPKNKRKALEIAGGDTKVEWIKNDGSSGIAGSTTSVVGAVPTINVFRGEIDVIVWDRLTGTYDDYYYHMDLSKPFKPLVLGEHRAWQPITLDSLEDLPRFLDGRVYMGIEGDYTPACGAWPTIYGSIL